MFLSGILPSLVVAEGHVRNIGARMKTFPAIVCGVLFVWLQGTLGAAQQADVAADGSTADGVVVQRVVDKGLMLIQIAARDGKVAWEDVLRALLRVGYMDDTALKEKFPSGSLNLNRVYSRFSLLAINVALAPDIRIEIIAKSQRAPAHLLMTIDEDAIRARKRKLARQIRDRVTGGTLREGKFGLRFNEDWEQSDARQALVIVVHGFNSSSERFESLADALRQAGLLCATYSYPDDQPIVDSAKQLSLDLKKLATDHPQRPIFLVTHSMGGLVSRCVIERPDLDPGNVTKLIMIAPPTHGSVLAYIGFGIDLFDHASDGPTPDDVTRFYAAVEDGLCEARNDLKPNSPFLRKLNSRTLNPNVRYAIFLGTGGRLNQNQVDRLREGLQTAAERSTAVGLFAPHLVEKLADLDEVIEGKGDGVVAVKRGRLEGVTDTVLADFTHLNVLRMRGSFQDDKVFQGVLKRLQK